MYKNVCATHSSGANQVPSRGRPALRGPRNYYCIWTQRDVMVLGKGSEMKRLRYCVFLFLGVFHGTTFATPAAEPLHFREATQDVNNRTLREQPGLHPGTNLLFNGWGVTPAGRHVSVPDLALKLVIAPDHRRLVAVHGGFTEHGVSLIDITKGEQSQFLALKKSWNGLAF